MATIRASCMDCGDVELTTHQVKVRVCSHDNQGSYCFKCPKCKNPFIVHRPKPGEEGKGVAGKGPVALPGLAGGKPPAKAPPGGRPPGAAVKPAPQGAVPLPGLEEGDAVRRPHVGQPESHGEAVVDAAGAIIEGGVRRIDRDAVLQQRQ